MGDMPPTLDEDWDDWEDAQALAILLKDEVIFPNSIFYKDKWHITLYVLCNDLFAWALADAEEFGGTDVEDIYKFYKQLGHIGVSKWCCIHRNMKPQRPYIEMMKKQEGVWDDQMENLPDNYYDTARAKNATQDNP
jgi:hypothetical protein